MKGIKEDGEGGAAPSNTVGSGQVDMTPRKKLFKDLYRRTKKQREMDEHYMNLFKEIMIDGK